MWKRRKAGKLKATNRNQEAGIVLGIPWRNRFPTHNTEHQTDVKLHFIVAMLSTPVKKANEIFKRQLEKLGEKLRQERKHNKGQ